jgi:hypothetical protein
MEGAAVQCAVSAQQRVLMLLDAMAVHWESNDTPDDP